MQTASFFISAIGPYERAFKRRGAKTAEDAMWRASAGGGFGPRSSKSRFLLTGTDHAVFGVKKRWAAKKALKSTGTRHRIGNPIQTGFSKAAFVGERPIAFAIGADGCFGQNELQCSQFFDPITRPVAVLQNNRII